MIIYYNFHMNFLGYPARALQFFHLFTIFFHERRFQSCIANINLNFLCNKKTDMVYYRFILKLEEWTRFWLFDPIVDRSVFAGLPIAGFGDNSILNCTNVSALLLAGKFSLADESYVTLYDFLCSFEKYVWVFFKIPQIWFLSVFGIT